MVLRLWRDWAAPEQSQAHEQLLAGQIAPAMQVSGFCQGLNRDGMEPEASEVGYVEVALP